jgi:hypothetical protein
MAEKTFGIYIPSYKRSDTCVTHKMLDYYKYVVRASEEKLYRAAGIENLVAVEDHKINGFTEVYKWMIENTPEDIICVIDDDLDKFYYRLERSVRITDTHIITDEIERIAQLLSDLEIGFAACDPNPTVWNYSSEFTFKGVPGGCKWINKEHFHVKYDKAVEHNFDIDWMFQELMGKNRIILKPMYFCQGGGMDTNAGGNSDKSRKEQVTSVELMKLKWGRYFSYNFKNNKPNVKVDR